LFNVIFSTIYMTTGVIKTEHAKIIRNKTKRQTLCRN